MQIHVLADLHLEFGTFTPPATEADVVVLAGDVHTKKWGLAWARTAFGDTPVVYVLGNHEYYGEAMPNLVCDLRSQAAGSTVHVIENEAVEIGGVVFLGCTLWSDFCLFGDPRLAGIEAARVVNDFKKIRVAPEYGRLTPLHAAALHGWSVQWLAAELDRYRGKTIVVVTHHAPSRRSLSGPHADDIVSAAFASELDDLVECSGAALWVHGHVHRSCDYTIGSTRVVCNTRGYPFEQMTGFDPALLMAV